MAKLPIKDLNFTSEHKYFLDTNILVYAYDSSAQKKHDIAKALVLNFWKHQNGVLSQQVLNEFYITITTKVPQKLAPNDAKSIINDLLNWKMITNDGIGLLKAIDIQVKYKISFWDSLIVEAALRSNSHFLLTEDLNSKQKIDQVTILNPFH